MWVGVEDAFSLGANARIGAVGRISELGMRAGEVCPAASRLAPNQTPPSKLMDIATIIGLQNHDGGWSYRKAGSSWTEPTVFALLAQLCGQSDAQSVERGFTWLRAAQRPDGGWPPSPSITQSTWVTAMAALLPRDALGGSHHASAIDWLMGQTGQETDSFAFRMRSELLGSSNPRVGWPFFPGAAAWVTPTAMSILALEKARRHQNSNYSAAHRSRASISGGPPMQGRGMELLPGANVFCSGRACSYPETHRSALLALDEVELPRL